jgi:DNA-binding MarR family transcriptional regulator
MSGPSQEDVQKIEQALVAIRHSQSHARMHERGFRGGPDALHGDGAGHGWPGGPGVPGSSGGEWHRGGPGFGRGQGHGPHDRSLGGAARFRLLDALRSVEGAEKPMGVSEIAEAIGVDQPRASRLVNDAAERGLVRRDVDPRDARRSSVQLTDAGRAALEAAHSNRREAVTDALADFTPDEIASFAALFSRFVAALPRG